MLREVRRELREMCKVARVIKVRAILYFWNFGNNNVGLTKRLPLERYSLGLAKSARLVTTGNNRVESGAQLLAAIQMCAPVDTTTLLSQNRRY